MQFTINFYECEHNGDLDNYKDNVRESGGDILNSGLDYEAEIGWVKVQVDNIEDFKEKLSKTDAWDFIL